MTAQQHIRNKYSSRYSSTTYPNTFSTADFGGACCGPNYNNVDDECDFSLYVMAQYPIQKEEKKQLTGTQVELFNNTPVTGKDESTGQRLRRIERETNNKYLRRPGEIVTYSSKTGAMEIYFNHDSYFRSWEVSTQLCMVYPYPNITLNDIHNLRKLDYIFSDFNEEYLILDTNDLDGGIIEVRVIGGEKDKVRFATTFKEFLQLIKK